MRSQNSLCSSSKMTENPCVWEKRSLVPTSHSVPIPLLRTLAGLQITTTFPATGVHVPLRLHQHEVVQSPWGNYQRLLGQSHTCWYHLFLLLEQKPFVTLTTLELSILLKHKRLTTLLIYSNTGSISNVTKYCKKQYPMTPFT